MSEPMTRAGKAHAFGDFCDWEQEFGVGDDNEAAQVRARCEADVAAIEAEARAEERERLAGLVLDPASGFTRTELRHFLAFLGSLTP